MIYFIDRIDELCVFLISQLIENYSAKGFKTLDIEER